MISILRYHLKHLNSFSGREARRPFWLFTAMVVGLGMTVWTIAMVRFMSRTFATMHQFAVKHPDQATVTRGPGSYAIQIHGHHPELFPDFGSLIELMLGIVAVTVILLGGAVARRLHDRGWRGFWGLMPLPFLTAGMVLMPRIFAAPEPDMNLFFALFLNNLVYLILLGALVFLLGSAGDPNENRFGPPPSLD
jgi:uncharacterized membrane protein YhaH (DUF805 family)